MKRIIFLITFFSINLLLFSQQITGIVLDPDDSLPIPGAIIKINSTQTAVISDNNGKFELKVPQQGTYMISVSMTGYYDTTLTVTTNNKNPYKIILKKEDVKIQTVIINCVTYKTETTNALKIQTIKLSDVNSDINLADFLTQIPGIDLIKKGNAVAKPVIRGLTGTNILVLQDGFRLENYQFSEDHPFLADAIGTSEIEVIKGPASLLYGSDAIGGVINFISEQPAETGDILLDYKYNLASNGFGQQQQAGIKASGEHLKFGARGALITQSDFYDGAGQQVKNTRFNRMVAKTFLNYQTEKLELKLNYDYSQNKFGMCVPPVLNIITDNSNVNKYFYQNLTNHFVRSQNSYQINNITKLNFNFSFESNTRQLIIDTVSKPQINMRLQTATYTTYLKRYFNSNKLSIISGIQGFYKINRNQYYGKQKIIPDFDKNNIAGFFMLNYDNNKVKIISGLRYDYSSIMIPAQDFYSKFNQDTNMTYNDISWSIGTSFSVFRNLYTRINFARGFRTPNIPELTQTGLHGNRYEYGNQNLKSQNNYEADLSVHYHLPRIIFDAETFYNRINNYIFLEPTDDTASDGMLIYRYNQSNATIAGFEANLTLAIIKNLNVNTSYAWIIGKTNDDNLPFIPQNKLKNRLSFNIDKLWKLKNITVYVSNIYAFRDTNVSQFEPIAASYDLLDAGVSFLATVQGFNTEINLSVSNILNTKYNDKLSTLRDAGFYDFGRSFNLSFYIPLTYNHKTNEINNKLQF